MSHKGNMKKVGKSSKRMYGPRKLLVCGYSEPDRQALLLLLKENGLGAFSVIFATDDDLQKPIKELMASDSGGNSCGEVGEMKRAIIMSGFTQKQLHVLMTAYRKGKFPSQHWAALTPVSENWTVSALLDELAAEAEAIKKQRKP